MEWQSAVASVRGRYTLNVVPLPSSLYTQMCPPLCLTMPKTVERPRPVPLPCSLVVKNGSKICACVCLVHPDAGIGDGEHHVGARRDPEVLCARRLVEFDVGGLDCELAALRHRVPRVHDQVHDDLLDLARIGLHVAEASCG